MAQSMVKKEAARVDYHQGRKNYRRIVRSGMVVYGNVYNENTPIRRGVR